MFNGVRIRMTLLYLGAALALILLMGGGTYLMLQSYFQQTTDLALRTRLAEELTRIGAEIPSDLLDNSNSWQILTGNSQEASRERGRREGDSEHERSRMPDDATAGIIVLPLDSAGNLLIATSQSGGMTPVQDAVNAVETSGMDLRTVQGSDGSQIRLLTYRVTDDDDGVAVLQLSRRLNDQERVMQLLLIGLLVLGGVSALLVAAGSWWLAGRSLRPAQQAWSQQQAFIANASHELRTPLTLMHASAEMLLRHLPQSDQEQRGLASDILDESQHMSRLVDDLLLLSRLDNRRLPLERVPIALPALFQDIQRQMKRITDERQIRLEAHTANLAVLGDETRLRQVLLILLDNAIRYTPASGQIEMRAEATGRNVTIQVSDTGSGIAPEHLPHLFDRFYRADPARASSSGGTGLGLSIAQGLITAQGGQIAIDSQLERGTRVTLTLPAALGDTL